MFQAWETEPHPERLGDVETIEDAGELIDDRCRLRHQQSAAAGADMTGVWLRFEVRDEAGVPVAWASYQPDPAHPYEPTVREQLGGAL